MRLLARKIRCNRTRPLSSHQPKAATGVASGSSAQRDSPPFTNLPGFSFSGSPGSFDLEEIAVEAGPLRAVCMHGRSAAHCLMALTSSAGVFRFETDRSMMDANPSQCQSSMEGGA